MEFNPQKISLKEYRQRSLTATKEQLHLLRTSKDYKAWEEEQACWGFWSLRISVWEVLVLIATIGLIAGVCYGTDTPKVRHRKI